MPFINTICPISDICKQNRYDYLDIRDILNSTIVNGDYLSNLFPAFVLNRLSNEYAAVQNLEKKVAKLKLEELLNQ